MSRHEIVIAGGRAIDPETGLDAVRWVGVDGDTITAVSSTPLEGLIAIDATDHIVAPGFIDLHSHGQQVPAAWMQAFDGVTTALELEVGAQPVDEFYQRLGAGHPINYGASASWMAARAAVLSGIEMGSDITASGAAMAATEWQRDVATEAQIGRIVARLEQELDAGALGIGIGLEYGRGSGHREYHQVAQLAADREVGTFTHVRHSGVKEPGASFEALQEIIAVGVTTGARMHICHINSTCGRDIRAGVGLIRAAQARGVPITVEAYPYGANATLLSSELFRGDDWLERWGVDDVGRLHYDGRPVTEQSLERLRRENPTAMVSMHFLRPEIAAERDLLDASVLFEGGAIASDGMWWTRPDGTAVTEDVWPLPDDAYAHPRSAACFTRFLTGWVIERQSVSWIDAIRKTSLIPAQIIEGFVPEMRRRGRLQEGSAADIVVIDPATLHDNATFVQPTRPSTGMRHVFVNGQAIIADGERIADARPGRAIRR